MADEANLEPPTVLYGDQRTCPSCQEAMTKLSTAPRGHSAYYDCLKSWGNYQIQQGNCLLLNLSVMQSPHETLLAPEEQEIRLLFAWPGSKRKIEAPSTKTWAQAAEASECRHPWWKSILSWGLASTDKNSMSIVLSDSNCLIDRFICMDWIR